MYKRQDEARGGAGETAAAHGEAAVAQGEAIVEVNEARLKTVADHVVARLDDPRLHLNGSFFVLFKQVDADGSGNIEFFEFRRAMREGLALRASLISETDLALLWDHVDADSSGTVTVGELARFVRRVRNKTDETADWFKSLVRCLRWNERLDQAPFDEEEVVKEVHTSSSRSEEHW